MLKTEAIKNVLVLKTHPDLFALYTSSMEVQINVAKDQGTAVEGDYKGKRWIGYTDGATTWKPFRIPHNANTNPVYEDSEIKFDLFEHVEGIGMTGWNWRERMSYWVAFDFDAMCGHADTHMKKLTAEELAELQKNVANVPWVTLRKSTSGKGLHLYVFLHPVPTANHTEHSALARSILTMLSAITGYDFTNKVDICGGNMWVWHRKMIGTDGLKLIKAGTKLVEIPSNWKEHKDVVSRRTRKASPEFLEEGNKDSFENLTQQYNHIPLDEEHKKLIDYLIVNELRWYWSPDHHMLVTHTSSLKDAHSALKMKGMFETISKGTDQRNDHNCFCFPLKNGSWSIRRYGERTGEARTWQVDQKKFTFCYLNKQLDLKTACLFHGGIEHEKGGWTFREVGMIVTTLASLGLELKVPIYVDKRPGKIIPQKMAGKIAIHIEAQATDRQDDLQDWLNEKKLWKRVLYVDLPEETEIENTQDYDDTVRHVVNEAGEDMGWRTFINGMWRNEPYVNIRLLLKGSESAKDIDLVLSQAIKRGWRLVNKPFQGEYPGDRQWNTGNAKLKIVPTENIDNLSFPTWQAVMDHCGESLNEALLENEWAKENGITTGGMYLKLWITSMIKYPTKSLPYLCFWGDPDCGKSTYHEAITECLIDGGHIKADTALTSQQGFNGELEGKILGIIEEVDLTKNKIAENRVKDWVTGTELTIHRKGSTPYTTPNYTKWIQSTNERAFCPITQGDARITLMYVGPLKQIIGRDELRARLKKEAPDFLASILATEIPSNNDRLVIPVIRTRDKEEAMEAKMSVLEIFLKDHCFFVPGSIIKIADFFERFKEFMPPEQLGAWSKQKVSANLPTKFVKGRNKLLDHCYGNISFDKNAQQTQLLVVNQSGYLKAKE